MYNRQPPPDLAPDEQNEYVMPCAEAMLAGTLALMTGYTQHNDAGVRGLMAKKVVSNLIFLSGHPHLSDAFRTVLTNLRTRWQMEAEPATHQAAAADHPSTPQPLWHASPAVVQ